jgi:hypothetical protein
MKLRTALAILSVVGIAVAPLACKKKEPENPQPFAPTPTYDPTAAPTATATAAPTATATAAPTATAQPTASVFDPAIAQLLAAQIQPIATQEAKGMQKSGEMMSGVLQEGQSLEQVTMLQPGKCYTMVGLGLPMIQELDITMSPVIPLPGAPNLPMAQDNKTGAQATLAPTPDCYKHVLPLPLQVKFMVTAKAGSGAVGAQLYVK